MAKMACDPSERLHAFSQKPRKKNSSEKNCAA